MRRVLVTGGAGLLGSALVRLAPAGWELHATQHRTAARGGRAHTVDLADAAEVGALWARLRPQVVIHTAYSMERGERDIWQATRNVADASRETGAALIHLSTDQVFDGERGPYAEDAAPSPIHEYGRWKARAEEYLREHAPGAAIVRASLLVSFAPPDPRSAWVAAGLRGEQEVTLFTDEIRSPIGVDDLALQLWEMAGLEPSARAGTWHLAAPESLSRFALGALIAATLGLPPQRLRAGLTRESAAPRPRDLRLLTPRADRHLRTRARPLSLLAAGARLASDG